MLKLRQIIIMLALSICTTAMSQNKATDLPKAVYPIPTPQQVEWQQMETYAFIHFGLNTFSDSEWGYGNENPEIFQPSRLDCEQWTKTCKAAGMRGIILTAKHHDGFCLWPTKYTDYNISQTSYKDGKGDIVKELSDACRKYDLKFGIYLSPWDRHQKSYGRTEYLNYYYSQLEELLTSYGDVFELWFDGANGGDGYYGGANEKRIIDRRTYYGFENMCEKILKWQPNIIIFSDGGPGCRWVGNEKGYANATNWSFLRSKTVYPGYAQYEELQSGHADGYQWVAAECNTSIRPGWFYHEQEDQEVKTVEHLVDLYYRSVGHNGTFLLNFPVDKNGLIHPKDSAVAVEFYHRIKAELSTNLLTKAKIHSAHRNSKRYSTKALTDNNFETFWATKENTTTDTLTINLKTPTKINRLLLQEYIILGQRIRSFRIEYADKNDWKPIETNEETTTIGYKRILRFPTITTKKLRICIDSSRGAICLSEIGAYYSPQ